MSWYYFQGILTLAGIYMVSVLGLSLLTGFTGLFSFGQAGFMAIGAYTTTTLMMNFHVPFIPALFMAGVMAAFISYFIGKLTLNLKGDYFCIATLGFGESIRLILDNVQYFGGARGWPGIPIKTNLTTVVVLNMILVIVLSSIVRSKYGRNMIAVREEELAAKVIGIDVFKHKVMSFMISAFYAGISGALLVTYMGFAQPKMFGLTRSTELTIIVIFGGLGSITGSVIGSLLLVALPELLREFANWRLVVYGAIVVFIIIARPEGLLGGKEFSLKPVMRLLKKAKVDD